VDKKLLRDASTFYSALVLKETLSAMKNFIQLLAAVVVLSVLVTGCMTSQGSCSAYQSTEQPAEITE
jgi:hypothetical protein